MGCESIMSLFLDRRFFPCIVVRPRIIVIARRLALGKENGVRRRTLPAGYEGMQGKM